MGADSAFALAIAAGATGCVIAFVVVVRFWRMWRSGALDPSRFGDRWDNDPRY